MCYAPFLAAPVPRWPTVHPAPPSWGVGTGGLRQASRPYGTDKTVQSPDRPRHGRRANCQLSLFYKPKPLLAGHKFRRVAADARFFRFAGDKTAAGTACQKVNAPECSTVAEHAAP